MRIRAHISLEVRDLEASIAFYTGLFQVEPQKRKPDYAAFRLHHPPLHLALNANPARGDTPSNVHYGIELFERAALDGWKAKVRARGIPIALEEEETICCYTRASKFWVKDPDGHAWELWVRSEDVAAKGEMPALGDGAACCDDDEKAAGCC